MKRRDKLTIIDFSSLLYSASYNCKVNDEQTDNFEFYKETLDLYVNSILTETKATHYICFGDGFTSFRKEAFKEFKGDRKAKPYMKFINDLKEYATTKWNIISNNFLEADDMCILAATKSLDQFDIECITIASKDSDLRQAPGKFFNYGYRRDPLYKATFKDDFEGDPEETRKLLFKQAFEIITKNKAYLNLWYQVLIKGHNNKIDYLEGCGKKTANKYITKHIINTKEAVLNAFINGIDKDDTIKRSVKGYDLNIGIEKFAKAFKQTYLLRTLDEVKELGYEWEVPAPIEIIKKDEDNEEW